MTLLWPAYNYFNTSLELLESEEDLLLTTGPQMAATICNLYNLASFDFAERHAEYLSSQALFWVPAFSVPSLSFVHWNPQENGLWVS